MLYSAEFFMPQCSTHKRYVGVFTKGDTKGEDHISRKRGGKYLCHTKLLAFYDPAEEAFPTIYVLKRPKFFKRAYFTTTSRLKQVTYKNRSAIDFLQLRMASENIPAQYIIVTPIHSLREYRRRYANC